MKIKIRYDDQITTVDVPEEEFTLMIEVDYEQRLEKAKDPSSVQRRSPQDIIDELNKADYNNWHKHNRRWDGEAVPSSIYGGEKHISSDVDDSGEKHHFDMDEFPDLASMARQRDAERDEELRTWIRKKLKPDYAEMLIAIHLDGLTPMEYADRIGDKANNISHRLQRAVKSLKKFSENVLFDPLPWLPHGRRKNSSLPGR